jgi:tRNA threonylcarbamoyladenosine biosynthesis protein TsaE
MNLIVKDLDGLAEAARELIPVLKGRGVVALYGGMGAGKTTLVSALLREMGSPDEVTSPTFALVNDYSVPLVRDDGGGAVSGGGHVYHFDFYRIDSLSEAFDLGYEEYFYGGDLCLVEWPEKIEPLLPDDTLRLHITVLPAGSRELKIET